jgi:hypothetical protein
MTRPPMIQQPRAEDANKSKNSPIGPSRNLFSYRIRK